MRQTVLFPARLRARRILRGMSIAHARSGQVVDLQDGAAPDAAQRSHAVFKGAHLEVMRLVLPAGASLPQHSVRGEITVQCLQGVARIGAHGQSQSLRPGQLLYLQAGVPHAVQAEQDCVLMVTVALPASTAAGP